MGRVFECFKLPGNIELKSMLDFVQSLILKVEGKFSTYVDNFFELIYPIL